MNDKFLKRYSTRTYAENYKLTKKEYDFLIDAINTAPTSVNGFQSSVIVVSDEKLKKAYFNLTPFDSQKHIYKNTLLFIFVADFNRVLIASKKENIVYKQNEINDFLVAFGDAFIQATRLESAANLIGLGACYLGGVRMNTENIKEAKKIFNITKKAIPVLAMTIGKPKDNASLKPKINRVYQNFYDINQIEKEINEYNPILEAFWKKLEIKTNYTKSVINYYSSEIDNDNWKKAFKELWINKK